MKSFDEDITKRIHKKDQEGALQNFFFEALSYYTIVKKSKGKSTKNGRIFTASMTSGVQ